MTVDLVVRGGRIADGTGNPWFQADVAIDRGRVAAIGELSTVAAHTVIDAHGKVLAPGFIDAHSHSDLRLFAEPTLDAKLRQGVTTEIIGQDGLSVAPLSDSSRQVWPERLRALLGGVEFDWPWRTVHEFLTAVDDARPAVNAAFLVPHGAVRSAAMGFDARAPERTELRDMQRLVEQALADGAVGVSTGLIYPPCRYADTEELIDLCRPAAGSGAPFVTHVRDEGERLEQAMEETLRVAREAGVPAHVSHLKAIGTRNHAKLPRVLAMFDAARADLEVTFDQYPYTAGSTFLSALLPPRLTAESTERMLQLLADPAVRDEVARELELPGEGTDLIYSCGWDSVRIGGVHTAGNRWCEGKTLPEVAAERGLAPADALFDLLIEEEAHATMVHFWGTEEVVASAIGHPLGMIGSDGIFGGKPHPRLYGTFPRVLGPWVRSGSLRLEEAVRRMTSAPARRFGLTGRGIVTEDAVADLVVFDAQRVGDTATYDHPDSSPVGIEQVIVNGVLTLDDGRLTGARAGRALRFRDGTPGADALVDPRAAAPADLGK